MLLQFKVLHHLLEHRKIKQNAFVKNIITKCETGDSAIIKTFRSKITDFPLGRNLIK